MNKALKWGAGLIGLYLGVYYATGGAKLIEASAKGGSNVIKAFQGR